MQLNQLPSADEEWRWVAEMMLHICNIPDRDLPDCDVRWDSVRFGYWVRRNSKTATMLALKGVAFGPRWHADYANTQGWRTSNEIS